MPTKQEVLDKLTTRSYNFAEVMTMIQSISGESKTRPTTIKKGDVISMFSGVKRRPGVVVKVLGDCVMYLPLTSTENIHNMSPSKSRFFGDGFFCKTFSVCSVEDALSNFVGVYDNPKLVNLAIKEFKKLIAESL